MKKEALEYIRKGFSVIPIINGTKKPHVAWEQFQTRKPTEQEIHEWFTLWPNAQLALVTGSISGVVVIDIDEDIGYAELNKVLGYDPFSNVKYCISSITPSGGSHLFFTAPAASLSNNTRVIPGCDFRGEGGYVLIPPSNGYVWVTSSLNADLLKPLPEAYINYIIIKGDSKGDIGTQLENCPASIPEGQRNETLFHAANRLFRGGADLAEVRNYLRILAKECDPPIPYVEVETIAKSALKRHLKRVKSVTSGEPLQTNREEALESVPERYKAGHFVTLIDRIRAFINDSQGVFHQKDVLHDLNLDRADSETVRRTLRRLMDEGLIEKIGGSYGTYRRKETDLSPMDFVSPDDTPLDIQFPMGVHHYVRVMPKNLIVIAGEANAGKTAFLMSFVELNMYKKLPLRYLSSEMGPLELKTRLKHFATPLGEWPSIFFERTQNFADLVLPDGITIVDYLEISDEFYKMGGMMTAIFNKLNTGIALIAIQKNPGTDVGLGGARGLEKPRLYLSMKPGELKIVKGKNWVDPQFNPKDLTIKFKLIGGAKFIEDPAGWTK